MIDYDPTRDSNDAVRAAFAILTAIKAEDSATAASIASAASPLTRCGIIAFLACLASVYVPDDELETMAIRNALREVNES